jgi:hypothetical protein
MVEIVDSLDLVFEYHVVVFILEWFVIKSVEGLSWDVLIIIVFAIVSTVGTFDVLFDLDFVFFEFVLDDSSYSFLFNKHLIEDFEICIQTFSYKSYGRASINSVRFKYGSFRNHRSRCNETSLSNFNIWIDSNSATNYSIVIYKRVYYMSIRPYEYIISDRAFFTLSCLNKTNVLDITIISNFDLTLISLRLDDITNKYLSWISYRNVSWDNVISSDIAVSKWGTLSFDF